MAADSILDLSKLDHWRGLRPGMSRAEVLAVVTAAGLEPSTDLGDPGCLLIDDWGMELRFTEGEPGRLRQIALDDDEARWAGQPLAGVPLDTALRTLGTVGDGARWRSEDAVASPFEDLAPPPPGPFSDETLLSEGTIWLPASRLGLVLCEGVVNEIVWRDAPDVPRAMIGPVTTAQRQISLRPDLTEHLRGVWSRQYAAARNAASPPADLRIYALTAACLCALAYVGWLSLQETRRWATATMLTGKVLTMETLPDRLKQQVFRVEYIDPTGRRQETSLVGHDFYITPRAIGDDVHLFYSNDDPPRILGETRVRDAAFLRYMPWAMGVGCVYFVGRLILVFIPRRKK